MVSALVSLSAYLTPLHSLHASVVRGAYKQSARCKTWALVALPSLLLLLCIYKSRFCICGVSLVQLSAVMEINEFKSIIQEEATQPMVICHIFSISAFPVIADI